MKAKYPWLFNIIKILSALFIISPFYLAFCYAVKTKEQIALTGLSFPTSIAWDNFTVAMVRTNFSQTLLNTVLTTVAGTLILTFACSMAAYVLARRKSWFYALFSGMLTLTILIPFHAYMFPLYLNIRSMGMNNSQAGYLLAKMGAQVGFSVIIMTGFVKGVPVQVEEATYIDGGGVYRTFFSVVMPLMKPILMTSVIVNALSFWNEYAIALVFLQDDAIMTLPLMQSRFFGQYSADLGQAFALFTLSMLPILILYFSFQRYVISGIVMGSVKG